MKNINRYILLFISIIMLCSPLYSQSIKELERKKEKALEELATTNRLLNETQRNKKGTENKINLLQRSIKQSNDYISTLNSELNILNHNIDSIEASKMNYEQRLATLKRDYARNSQLIYKQHKYFSPILFIVSAKDFNQAFRRYRYLKETSTHRKKQAEEIASIKEQLVVQSTLLAEDKMQKETVMSAKELEQQRLERQKRQKSNELTSLKSKEKNLKEKQRKQQIQANKLNQRIQDMIAAEIRRQQEAARKKQGNTAKKSSNSPYQMSKEEKLVAGNFEANKGKLPRPIEKGYIRGHFGVQPHPILDKVTINNKGIYLQTPAGADARVIFDGEVTQVFSVPGSNQSVIVKHGNYRTVYSNLTVVYVKVGDKIKTKQKIGRIFTDKENDNKTELYFMLYKNTEIQNPEYWLAK